MRANTVLPLSRAAQRGTNTNRRKRQGGLPDVPHADTPRNEPITHLRKLAIALNMAFLFSPRRHTSAAFCGYFAEDGCNIISGNRE